MGQLTVQVNTTGYMTPATDYVDSGWSIGAGIANHWPCNPGKLIYGGMPFLIVGHSYQVSYDVLNYVSGGVNVNIGTAAGTTQSANIEDFTQIITCTANTSLSFYSNGQLSIANLSIYDIDQEQQPVTFAFNEKSNQWSHQQSFAPDAMLKYGNNFYSWQNGELYVHNSPNVPRMNFYGDQYSAQITFLINADPKTIKILQGIVVESNELWWVPNITIEPYMGKSLGMQSRIKSGRFEVMQGVFYADFLRNLLDPRFGTQLQALLYGEELRGRTAIITIQNDGTDLVKLYKVQIKYAPQMLTP